MTSTPRRYKSQRRQLQAELTRRDILQAARRLFARHGYSRTSMEDVAAEAGVAVQTIYSRVGSKLELLRGMNDFVDEEGGIAELEGRMRAADQPREVLRLCVQLTRQVAERCGDIIGAVDAAARAEPEMAQISGEGRRRHREGTQGVVEALARAGALRRGMSVERAAQLAAVLTYNEVYSRLTGDYRMSYDEAQAWVLSTLEALLLNPPADARPATGED
jgi:AcrR family transcriptional regulator